MDDFRAASLQSWSSVAADWGELIAVIDRQLGGAAEWMVQAVGLQPGERVLELACGPGTVSLLASGRVGAEGHVICTDFAAPMVEVARHRIGAENGENVEFRVMDAEAIDLPDGAVDAVLCRMGFMLMADPAAALRESVRVLRPGGRLALAVWADAAKNPWAALPAQVVMTQLGAPPPPPGTPGMWALADLDGLRRMLDRAGLDEARIGRLDQDVRYESVERWFEHTRRLAGPLRAVLASLDSEAVAQIVQGITEAAAPYLQVDGSLVMSQQLIVAAAQRP